MLGVRVCHKGANLRAVGMQCRNGRLNVVPQRSNIPIVVATRGNLVLQIAGEVADGVMIATYAEPIGIRHALSMVAKGAKRAGRSVEDISLISRVDACISQDRQAAIEAVKPMVGVFLWTSYPDRAFVHRVGLQVPDELEQIIAHHGQYPSALPPRPVVAPAAPRLPGHRVWSGPCCDADFPGHQAG